MEKVIFVDPETNEEIEFFVNVKLLQGIVVVIPFVVVSVYGVVYMAVLHIGIQVQTFNGVVIGFQVNVRIVLCTIVAVVLVVGGKVAYVLLYP